MKFLNRKTHIDFMGKRKPAFILSGVLIILSIISLVTRGLNPGLDFTGGMLIEVSYPSAVEVSDVKANLKSADVTDAVVQQFGTATDIVVRVPPRDAEESSAELSTVVLSALQQGVEGEVLMRRVEFVGPQVGDELTEQGILAVVYALI